MRDGDSGHTADRPISPQCAPPPSVGRLPEHEGSTSPPEGEYRLISWWHSVGCWWRGPGCGMLTGCWGRGLADMQTHHWLTGQKKCSSFVSRLARRINSSNGSVLGGERKDGGAKTVREGTSHGWHHQLSQLTPPTINKPRPLSLQRTCRQSSS